jgi:two-component system sensor histidine kinase HydH
VISPLATISGAISTLRQLHDRLPPKKAEELLASAEEETERLNDIVTSFLRFSRPPPLRLQAADVNHVVKDTMRLISQEASEGEIKVIVSLDEAVPHVLLDVQQLRQALLNILVNALAATKPGDTVTLTTGVADGGVRIVIADTGAGMCEEVVKDIFKPCFTTKTRGSGLGLACAERIVREHGGAIAVQSQPGAGSQFSITLPLERSGG